MVGAVLNVPLGVAVQVPKDRFKAMVERPSGIIIPRVIRPQAGAGSPTYVEAAPGGRREEGGGLGTGSAWGETDSQVYSLCGWMIYPECLSMATKVNLVLDD